MPDQPLALATAGQLRRAGFVLEPDVDDDATAGFEILCNHTDDRSLVEHERATKRGDAFPRRPPRPSA